MEYFCEDEMYINTECETCKRVLKIHRENCIKNEKGFLLHTPIKCFCETISNEIVRKNEVNILAHASSFDVEFINEKVIIKNKGLNRFANKEYVLELIDIINTKITVPGLITLGKFKITFLKGKLTKEIETNFKKNELSNFNRIHQEINSYIRENKAECKTCGYIWYFNSLDVISESGKQMLNLGKNMLALGVFLPLALIPDSQVNELKRCSKCGSRAVTIKEVINRR